MLELEIHVSTRMVTEIDFVIILRLYFVVIVKPLLFFV